MDEEAKVRAHAVLDGGAGIDEALEAMAPGLVIAVAVGLPQWTSVTVHVHGFGLLGASTTGPSGPPRFSGAKKTRQISPVVLAPKNPNRVPFRL